MVKAKIYNCNFPVYLMKNNIILTSFYVITIHFLFVTNIQCMVMND